MLVIRVAELALGRARLRPEPLGAGLAHPEREARKREPPEQVVEVGMGRQQPVELESRLGEQRREELELVGEVRRVDQERLVAPPQRECIRLPHAARDHHGVGVDGDRTHRGGRAPARRPSAAWPRRGGS